MKFDFLIVGAGLAGATAARQLTDAGYKCLVIDRRPNVGGNVFTENIDGINVHKYGAHIFHTSDKKVWDYVTSFVDFNRYTNCPIAHAADGKIYNLPFNMNTFHQLWGVKTPEEARQIIDEQRREAVEQMAADSVKEPRNLQEQALTLVGRDIYEKLIKHYTEKQWGRKCTDLPAFIIRRLPVRFTFDNNYFNDRYQGIPIGGYTLLVEKMLDGVEVRLNTDFFDSRSQLLSMADRVVYTGGIDRYFDYCFGHLQYRTVRFETEIVNSPNFQGNAVINYTDPDSHFTRVIEHKHFESFGNEVYDNPHTVISREYSSEWKPGDEPYYPVNDSRNNELYAKYKALADKELNVTFCGRLAEYRYYDMHQVIARTIETIESLI